MSDEYVQQALAKSPPRPVLVHLHGTVDSGSERDLRDGVLPRLAKALAKQDVTIIVVNSLHRQFWDRGQGGAIGRSSTRHADVDYALQQLARAAWADPRRIFLHGQSEGAMTLFTYPNSGYAGAILSGFNCGSWFTTEGRIPPEIPILVLQDLRDPIMNPRSPGASCEAATKSNPRSKFVAYDRGIHSAYGLRDEVDREIRQFIRENQRAAGERL